MATRYSKTQKLTNEKEFYRFMRKKRGVRKIVQYATPRLANPGPAERAYLAADTHIWAYGDRFYNLAARYYGDVSYWWVIAWYNSAPTEADLTPGTAIQIPLNLANALEVLGV